MATVDAIPNNRSMAQETTTLTNWKRLTNITNVFNVESAQALVWNGYIVIAVGTAPQTLHFYHLAHELWSNVSAVSSSYYGGYLNMCPGCTLTTHGAKLLMLSIEGDVHELCGNKWIIRPELKVTNPGLSASRPAIFTSSSLSDDTPHSLVLLESQNGCSLHSFRYFQTSQWSQQRSLKRDIYVFPPQPSQSVYQSSQYHYQTSFAAKKGSIYVCDGKQVHCIDLRNPEAETIPVVDIARLPLLQYTISSVDGTLFAFGGKDEDNQPSSDVYRYSPCSEVWEPAGYMRSARYSALVIPVTENGNTKIVVIGGNLGWTNKECLHSHVMESCEVHTR